LTPTLARRFNSAQPTETLETDEIMQNYVHRLLIFRKETHSAKVRYVEITSNASKGSKSAGLSVAILSDDVGES
jgi:hypothetical protein